MHNVRTPQKSQGPTPPRKRRQLDFQDDDDDADTSASTVEYETSLSSTPSSEQMDSTYDIQKQVRLLNK
ncbi:hypothetical protein AAFF_G00380980 [Aldrovandia affinis]|uniref:Uncharacterized protein n=1 Tax=Aldrovandia affinis TaxID=143900 RepID=A0AAD7T9L3_9TELE|nr:hypothetical protein AAFF_G00380980 [Aldrovandia affinis]